MPAIERFGYNAPGGRPLEDVLRYAVEQRLYWIDFNADRAPNGLDDWDEARVQRLRALCEQHGIRIGIHTSSATNNAEIAPFVGEAVDAYLRANVDLAQRLGCEWVIVHGGFHFGDVARRRDAAVARLQRLAAYAAEKRVPLWLENHNWEPDEAEIHYIPDNVEELRWYFEAPGLAENPWLRWTFNAGHAELVPDKVGGFLEAFGVARMAQVRLMDNPGSYEKHLKPGEGVLDFPAIFRQIEGAGYTGPYCLDFPASDEERIRIRDEWLTL
jgi:sugar phosphate isomerase/epimerase